MFQKTRFRLILINSVVFFTMLLLFGLVLYFFTEHRLYMQEDQTLTSTAEQIKRGNADAIEKNRDDSSDDSDEKQSDEINELRQSHIVYLLRSAKGTLLEQVPLHSISDKGIAKLSKLGVPTAIHTVELDGVSFRVDTIEVPAGLVTAAGTSVRGIQLLYNRTYDNAMLRSFRTIIEICTLIFAGIATVAAFFLASRALVPIRKSWNKQQQFVADASHELRTPLTVLQMHLERLFRHPTHTIEQESESVAQLLKETSRMRRLVSDLLTLAKVDSNQILTLKKQMRLDSLVVLVVEQFRDLAHLKEVELQSSHIRSTTIWADEERIRQLMTILLDNAIKYSHEGGHIQVHCRTSGHFAHITVTDDGVGISKEDLPYIFDRFYRVDRTRSKGGTGLGLAIARWIVEEHHGTIRAESRIGEGTSIHVNLPLRAQD